MTTRKLNDFLDQDQNSENESHGYNSEAEDNIKKGGSSTKQRKVEIEQSEDEDEDEDLDRESDEDVETQDDTPKASQRQNTSQEEHVDSLKDSATRPRKSRPPSDLPNLTTPLKKNLVSTAAAIKTSGVIYLSRLPPFMKPSKLRSLLSPYGTLNRLFLTPESASSHSRRVGSGGNKKRSFSDGWVEFVRKVDAKRAVELLNGQTIGGKKGSFYRDDIWNLTYLKGFKWRHLTEQIQREEVERQGRLSAEVARMGREDRGFVEGVERGKLMKGMEDKRERRRREQKGANEDAREVEESGEYEAEENGLKGGKMKKGKPMHFKQLAAVPKKKSGEQSDDVKRVLSKIF